MPSFEPEQMKTSDQSEVPYPFIECDLHPGSRRCYIVCNHVFYGKSKPRHVVLATDSDMGEILCGRYHRETAQNFKCICEGCAIERGLIVQ